MYVLLLWLIVDTVATMITIVIVMSSGLCDSEDEKRMPEGLRTLQSKGSYMPGVPHRLWGLYSLRLPGSKYGSLRNGVWARTRH